MEDLLMTNAVRVEEMGDQENPRSKIPQEAVRP